MLPPWKMLIKDFLYQSKGTLPIDYNRALSLSLTSHICLNQENDKKACLSNLKKTWSTGEQINFCFKVSTASQIELDQFNGDYIRLY